MGVQIDQPPRARNGRVIRRVLVQRNAHKAPQRQRIRQPPGNAALRPDALEIPDQQRPKVNPRRQRRAPVLLRIKLRRAALDQRGESLRLQQFIQTLIERMPRSRCQLRVCDPQIFLLLPLLACPHRHAPILQTKPVDTSTLSVHESKLAPRAAKGEISGRDVARELGAIRDRFSEKPAKQVETRPTNLPVQRTGFVGREKEVAAAKELLLRRHVRLVTVTGPGGIGKTRLAVQVASSLVDCFPGGIHFVSLSWLSDPDLIASVIVQTLGIREAGGQSPFEILKENLRDSLRAPMLLLLDNFEHLVQAVPTVAELLVGAPNLKILVTSRPPLDVYGEHEFPVPPLALPDSRSMPPLEVLSQYPAVALFVQRAVAAKPDFELNRENALAIAEICARLDGLPLAIELAAARVKVLSPSSLLTRLASRLQLLTGGARDLPQRQQTLRAAMDWSYDLLNAAEQKLFRRLSVFVGGCNLEGVEAVCDTNGDLDLDLVDGMASMMAKSLFLQVPPTAAQSPFS